MKVSISALNICHAFDLARELNGRSSLAAIFSGYPRFKLRNEHLPQRLIHTFPWVYGAYRVFPNHQWLNQKVHFAWRYYANVSLDQYVANKMPDCDVFVGFSGSALISGKRAHKRGSRYVCDRGAAHIRTQDLILREEHEIWGVDFPGIDPRMIEREEAEYAEADCITVPSTFALKTFYDQGIKSGKVKLLPYGANLSRFHPVEKPDESGFNVLYVGAMTLQKGVQYLVQAFQKLQHPAKSLTIVGSASPWLEELLRKRGLWPEEARVIGHVEQSALKHIMSRSHVLVLPSVQDGFGMVMAQAMACGCPVVATEHTGAADLFISGQQGYIVPIRNPEALLERLQYLADFPEQRNEMGGHALARVLDLGGWRSYGENAGLIYEDLLRT